MNEGQGGRCGVSEMQAGTEKRGVLAGLGEAACEGKKKAKKKAESVVKARHGRRCAASAGRVPK
jgi:hypothetical protein